MELTSLLAGLPERVGDELGPGTTTNLCGFPVCSNLDAAQLGQVDFDTAVHLAQSGDSSMHAIVCKEGHALLVGEFDLYAG